MGYLEAVINAQRGNAIPRNTAPTLWTVVITGRTPEQLRRTFGAHDFDGVIDARLEPGTSRERLEAILKVRPKYVWLGATLGVDSWGYAAGTSSAISKILDVLIAKARRRQRLVLIIEGQAQRERIAGWLDVRNVVCCHLDRYDQPEYVARPNEVHARLRRGTPSVFA